MERQGHHGAVIEALLLTHPHNDHYNGSETISRHFDINHYYDPGYPSNLVSYSAFLDAIRGTVDIPPRAHNIHIGQQNFGQIDWGKELQVEVLYSWSRDPQHTLGSGNTEVNNASIVLKLTYGNHSFLFMGDAEGKDRHDLPDSARYVERVLLQDPSRLQSTVLKIAHHGSETSSTLPFIQAVNPEVVIVQSGRKSFGGTFLPDNTTLQRYCDQIPNVRIFRTDQGDEQAGLSGRAAVDGDDITIRTNGSGQLLIQAFQGGQPFNGNFCGN
jgi:beta-lactamase superfamily II metal-dependent hydrolase